MKFSSVILLSLVVATLAVIPELRSPLYDRKTFPEQFKLAGFPKPHDQVRFVFGLKQRNLDQLEELFWAVSTPGSSEYQNFRTNDELVKLIAPPQEDHDHVVNWLRSKGVSDIQSRGDNLKVVCSVTVAEDIFQTKMYVFKHHKKPVKLIRQMGPFSLPTHITNIVDLVAGITDFPMLDADPKIMTPNAGADAVIPQICDAQYNAPNVSAPDTTQGVIEFGAGQYYDPDSLAKWSQLVGIPIAPLTPDHIINPLPPAGIEGTLDIQYIATLGFKSVNWYWTENDWLFEWATNFSAATAKPQIVSISYGWSELAQCDIDPQCSALGVDSKGYVTKVNTEFQKIGLQGVSILSASGDSGANGRTDPDCSAPQLRPPYPAASPYLTAVGATQLVNPTTVLKNPPPICSSFNCASGGQETAVSYDEAHFTSGGGFSNWAPQPAYQKDAVTKYLNSGVALPPASMWFPQNRGFPDIASLGNAILIYSAADGGILSVGGTSASSPSIAGYMSLLNEVSMKKSGGKPLGFLNPLLYKMFADRPDTFTDITVGDNKCTESGCASTCQGFMCAAGWDPVTGLGVPNIANMLDYVKKM